MSDDKPVADAELVDMRPEDAMMFRVGQPVVMQFGADGSLRRLTGWRLLAYRVRQKLHDWTRWWRPRLVVSEVNTSAGAIALVEERWSWRRWRWERAR